MKRKLEGERKAGGKGGVRHTVANDKGKGGVRHTVANDKGKGGVRHTVTDGEGWTREKTAKDLNISTGAVSKAKQIAQAIKEHPVKKI